jgi:hypothetical protein
VRAATSREPHAQRHADAALVASLRDETRSACRRVRDAWRDL